MNSAAQVRLDIACLEIRTLGADPRGRTLIEQAHALGIGAITDIACVDLVFVEGSLDADQRRLAALELASDPLLVRQAWRQAQDSVSMGELAAGTVIETTYLPGVTDAVGAAVVRACVLLGLPVRRAATGRRFEVHGRLEPGDLERLAARVLANPVIERWTQGEISAPFLGTDPAGSTVANTHHIETIELRSLGEVELAQLNRDRGLALDPEEMLVVQEHFRSEGRDPTDAELETLAQTWSEHCAHKTFRADITMTDGTVVSPLLARLRATTDAIGAPWVRSAFVGNAGIVDFAGAGLLAVKVETHNHPSAIEPFGGANTGVGGVLRDVMAAPARPIAATDVLCFGPRDLPAADVPRGSLHPQQIFDGVVAGVADYGNKLGVPTVAGAVLYDPGYTANPLVFCGCVGLVSPGALEHLTGPHPDDRVVVIGGQTGRDGLRGATFSSMTMDATTGEVAGASVQIGDPITEKLVADALDDAVAEGLFTALTDCGAGGLSSAVGEMADGIGADVDLAVVPLKYAGLAPWEIWLSEAQERMVLAVPAHHLARLEAICQRRGVECTDIGRFTGDGRLRVRHGAALVVDLDTAFLHDGRPRRQMVASRPQPCRDTTADAPRARSVPDLNATLLALLAHPNIASKQAVIHRYDHEVQGRSVVRALVGATDDGPADGVVLADPRSKEGFAIGIGVNPWHGLFDPERMGWSVVDEAVRNVVVAGADPDRIALLDNFSWGDPRRAETLGALVAAVDGCCDASAAHGAPFVSGKDSLNNEYEGHDGARHAVPPTLVITAVGHVPNADRVTSPDLQRTGNVLVLTGTTRNELRGSHLDLVLGTDGGGVVPAPDLSAPSRYRAVHHLIATGTVRSAHDCSEGGLGVALCEMAIGGGLGIRLRADALAAIGADDAARTDPVVGLFAESCGRIILELASDDGTAALASFASLGASATIIGDVIGEPVIDLLSLRVQLDQARSAWGAA